MSFQLSFLAVGGIILMYPIIDQSKRFKSRVLQQICMLTQLGIAAQFAIMPLSLLYFGQLSWLSPISSIWSIIIVYLIIILSLLLLALFPFSYYLITKIQVCIEFLAQVLTSSTALFSKVHFATIFATINQLECALLLAGSLCLILGFYNTHRKAFFQLSSFFYLSQSIYHLHQKLI